MVKKTDPELDKLRFQLNIEKSLDRVRNLAMRMKESDDLKKVVAVLFDEMGKLGFDLYDSNIGILDKKTMDLTYYGSGLGGVEMLPGFVIPFQPGQSPYIDAIYTDLKRGKKFNAFEFSGKTLAELKDFYITKTGFGKAPKEYIEGLLSLEYLVLSYTTMKYGLLEVAGAEPLDANKITILKRFARVLELTYTRFYDLKKVEEQALEAQIEAALEKVRARAMAMDSSDELGDALQRIAEGAALMTDTEMSRRIVGTAYPRHFNRPIALAMDENIQACFKNEFHRLFSLKFDKNEAVALFYKDLSLTVCLP